MAILERRVQLKIKSENTYRVVSLFCVDARRSNNRHQQFFNSPDMAG